MDPADPAYLLLACRDIAPPRLYLETGSFDADAERMALAVEGCRHEAQDVLLAQLLHHFGEHRVHVVVHANFVEGAARLEGEMFELTARALGANRLQVFRKVTLPLLAPTIVGSALLVIGWSFDDFVLTFFTIGTDNTLPIVIWGQMRAGISPTVNAVSTLMLATTVALVLIVRKLARVRMG